MKKEKLLLLILPIALVVIIAIAVGVLYFATDIFKSNDELFAKYFMQNEQVLGIIENANIEEQKQFKTNNSYNLDGDLTISIQDETNTQEVKTVVTARHDVNTERTYSEMTMKNGEEDLLKISYINSSDIYAIKCDEIIGNYIGIRNNDLQTLAKNMGILEEDVENIPNNIDFTAINSITELTEEQKQHIKDTYSKVILENIPKDKFSKLAKSQISIDGTSYNANAYQLTIDGNIMKQIIVNCLTTLKGDNTTLVILSNKLSLLGLNSKYTDITKMAEWIDNLITQIQDESTNINDTIEIIVYESGEKTIRTVISLTNQSKITIDQSNIDNTNNNTKKAIISIENNNSSDLTDTMTEETTPSINATTISQIILQKIVTDSNIANGITVIPDTTNMAQLVTITTSIGKVQNNTINSTSNISISNSLDGINIETINTSYTQNIQATNEVEEIMELKNSNTIIMNNYTKEQLIPFLTNIGNKIGQIVPNKIGQLGINISTNQNENTITDLNNTILDTTQMIGIVGTAGMSIANVNGVKIENIGVIGITGIGMYIYNQANNTILNIAPSLSDTTSVKMYNSMFESYEGNQTGVQVKNLCDIVKNHNLTNADNIQEQVVVQMSSAINITYEPNSEITSESIDTIKTQIQPEKTYTIDFGYSNSTGKIVAIGIIEK